jgi:hypothetical protein
MPFGTKEPLRDYWGRSDGVAFPACDSSRQETSWQKSACPNNTARADNRMRRIGRKVITGKNITI